MKKVFVGDFVETIHNVNGILTEVRRGYDDGVAFIATSDMRTFYCPISDLKNAVYAGEIKEPLRKKG